MSGTSRSGRKRKPSAIRKAEGRRGHSRPLTDDVQALGVPKCPGFLSPPQRKVWAEVVRSMPPEVFTSADSGLLANYAVAAEVVERTSREIERGGLMVRGVDGHPVRNPLLSVRSRAMAEMRCLASDLGLSPAARAKLPAQPTGESTDMEMLLDPDFIVTGSPLRQ